jgi:hypothetical protein
MRAWRAEHIGSLAIAERSIDSIDLHKSVEESLKFPVLSSSQNTSTSTIMGNETSKPGPTTLYGRISKAIPPTAPQYGVNENSDWVDKGMKAFASEGDRDQFICKFATTLSSVDRCVRSENTCANPIHKDGLISLATSNGSINLENHDIKLFFSRRKYEAPIPTTPPTSSTKPAWRALMPGSPSEPDDGTRLLATLVAIDETGVIRVKIASEEDGRDVAEAFRAFKKDVEIKLEKLLSEVPNGPVSVHGQADRRSSTQRTRVAPAVSRPEREIVDAPPPAYGDVSAKKG